MKKTKRKFGLTKYTLDRFFENVLDRYPSRPALSLIEEKPITYTEFGERVATLKDTLRALGIRKGERIIILGESSPNWGIAYMAITTMGAVAVPILEGFPDTDIDHIIRHAGAAATFISGTIHQGHDLPALGSVRHVIMLDDFSILSGQPDNHSSLWKQVQDFPDRIRKTLERTSSKNISVDIAEDDLAEILYTSGTTGHSKGVMLTHGNLVSNSFEGPDLLKIIHSESIILSILPMAHAFGCTSAFLSIIYCGSHICYLGKAPSPKILLNAMQEVRPTIMGAVPLVFEKIFHKQVAPTIAGNPALRLLLKTRLTRKLLYRIVGRKVKKLLGGRLDCVIIGGASFSPEVETFLKEGGIPYCCGYGLSECSPLVTFSSMETRKMGSPGHAITDVTIKITNSDPKTGIGEICVKGPNVMKGYYRDEDATREAFTEDGWFITGDRGFLDSDGYLFITGRSKNVIVGPSGENIYPETIEALLIESIYVEEALVYQTDNRIVARIHPNYAYLETMERTQDEHALATDIADILEDIRKDVNSRLPVSSRISRIIEQQSPFVKTPTNKIKRAEYVPGYLNDRKD